MVFETQHWNNRKPDLLYVNFSYGDAIRVDRSRCIQGAHPRCYPVALTGF